MPEQSALRFHVLGPLEVRSARGPVPLRGLQQRSVLGFLLLHANTAVATSDLIRALWQDEVPATARKMLQNAVAGVRAVFGHDAGLQPAVLLTHPPGYLLCAPAHRIDVCRFEQTAKTGRDLLAAGEWSRAGAALRDALELWRGPVLADLAETGIVWPEIAVLRNAQLAVLEDYAETQLVLDQHHDVVARLEAVMAGDGLPARERMAAQLMMALYRSGRQADALQVYRRTRSALTEQLGLEPSRDLRELERAILMHDPVLSFTPGPGGLRAFAPGGRWAGARAGASMPLQLRGRQVAEPVDDVPKVVHQATASAPTEPLVSERKPVTVLLVRAGYCQPTVDRDPEDLRAAWQQVDAEVEEVIRRHGGRVRREAVGPLWTASFGVPRTHDDDVTRAVGAAVELSVRLRRQRTVPGDDADRLVVRLAVASGEAVVSYRAGTDAMRAEVAGGVFDTALRLLSEVPEGQLRVCDTTRSAGGGTFRFARPRDYGSGWVLTGGVGPGEFTGHSAALVERHGELRLLTCILDEVRRQRRANQATLLGEPGMGRTRLVEEFSRLATAEEPAPNDRDPLNVVVARAQPLDGPKLTPMLIELNHQLADLADDGVPDLVDPPEGSTGDEAGALVAANRRLVERVAERGPLVLVMEDLHLAEDRLLDHVEDLVHHNGVLPVLVLATARPELLERRPYWAGGSGRATAVTLEPLSDAGTRDLLDALWHVPPLAATAHVDLAWQLVEKVAGNPRFAVEYIRQLREQGAERSAGDSDPAPFDADDIAIPPSVHRMIAARLDSLPAGDKSVLRDAAVLGHVVCVAGVAAASGRPLDEVEGPLRMLESRGILRRLPGRPVSPTYGQIYVFRHSSVRQVAYAQLLRAERAERHYRLASWLKEHANPSDDLLTDHLDRALMLSRATGTQLETAAGAPPEARAPRTTGLPVRLP